MQIARDNITAKLDYELISKEVMRAKDLVYIGTFLVSIFISR